jgi:ADP-ribose pyrophosphatase YjhB (NUDIX family)
MREPQPGNVVERRERKRMKLDLEFARGTALQTQSGAYALIRDAEDRMLLVRAANGRFYLPGGRVEPDETPEHALAREVEEECGWSVRVTALFGEAFQPIMDGRVMLRATYWQAELTSLVHEEPEHQMLWTPRAEAASRLHRAADADALLSLAG